MMYNTFRNGQLQTLIRRERVVIGSRFDGQNLFIDQQGGTFWHAMPALTDNDLRVQRAILNRKAPKMPVDKRLIKPVVIVDGMEHYKDDPMTKASRDLIDGPYDKFISVRVDG